MATIAWMDSQLGRVLDELEALQHHKDTLVVLHADHGYSQPDLCHIAIVSRTGHTALVFVLFVL